MAAVNVGYAKKSYTFDNSQWVALVAPINCNNLTVRVTGNVSVLMRTDPADATTQDSLAVGSMEVLTGGSRVAVAGAQFRFPSGITFLWVQSAGASTSVVVTALE